MIYRLLPKAPIRRTWIIQHTSFPTSGIPLGASPISRGGELLSTATHSPLAHERPGTRPNVLAGLEPQRAVEQVWGGLGGPKENNMKWYLILWTFGLIVAALSIRVALELAMLGRSWS